jgi:hypothetical protein
MPDLLDQQAELDGRTDVTGPAPTAPVRALPPAVETDERAARRELRKQIARLESELADLFATAFPRDGFEWGVRTPRGGPRLLPLAELERVRDDLAERLERNRRQLDRRAAVEERNRRRIEEMMLEPERHKWAIISNEDIGERGCKHWQVLPEYGLLGLLKNWWRVRISSGCPLAGGRGPRP